MIKRLFDLLVSTIGIVLLFIPFIVISLIVKLSSNGPVFYSQVRIGYLGKPFEIIKFRTMYTGSEKHGSITTASDSRITPIGKTLRNYKLDELPQLINVFLGKMSFVGPRPDVPGYADKLVGDDRRVLNLRPGITGPASIYYKNEEELLANQNNPKEYNDLMIWPNKVKINIDYLEHYSLIKDIGYIMITVIPALDKWFGLMEAIKMRLELRTEV